MAVVRYRAEREFPKYSSNALDITRLFSPESAPYQKAIQSLLGTTQPILGCDLEYNEPERYKEVPTVLGVSDGFLTVSVPFNEGISYFEELIRKYPDVLYVGHAFSSADVFAFKQVGIELNRKNVHDTIIWHTLTNAHLNKAVSKSEDGDGIKKGKGYMNLWTFISLYTNLANWKDCIGEENGCDGSRPCWEHNFMYYNAVDSIGPVLALPNVLRIARIRKVDKLYDMHLKLSYRLAEMARFGVQTDRNYLFGENGLQVEFERQKQHIEEILPFNVASNKAGPSYFKDKGILLKDWQEATLREACEDSEDDELHLSLDWKALGNGTSRWFAPIEKSKSGNWSGYMDSHGKIHPRLGYFTSTSRLNCVSPNLQNLSARRMDRHNCECGAKIEAHPTTSCLVFKGISVAKLIRRAVCATPGWYLCEADESNAENRTFLHLAGHTIPHGVDGHTQTAEFMGLTSDMEFVKATGGGKTRQAAKSAVHGCLTGDHEILTPQGWKRIDSCNDDTVLAQWNVADSSISFVKAQKFHEYDFSGDLVRLDTRGLQTLATENHAWPVNISGTWNKIKYNKTQRKTFVQLSSAGRIAVNGNLVGGDMDISDDTIRRCVAVQADARIHKSRKGEWYGSVTFHIVKQRKKDRLKLLFGIEGKPCKCHPNTGSLFQIDKSVQYPLLDGQRRFNEKLLLLSQRQREVFLAEILLWDGCVIDRGAVNYSYCNTDFISVMWIQTLVHLSGRQSLMREITKYKSGYAGDRRKRIWRLSFNQRKYASFETMKTSREFFEGKVYCFTIPTGYFLTRYRDTIHVTGNSFYLEGLQLKFLSEMRSQRVKKEIEIGARVVFWDWIFEGKIVSFTGANLAQRAFGDKSFENRIKANEILNKLFSAYPNTRNFQKNICAKMERERAIVVPHGYYLQALGDAERRMKTCAAMYGSNPVAHFTKLALLRLWDMFDAGRPIRPVLQIHDAILCEVRDDIPWETARAWTREAMEVETPEIPGLIIPTDFKYSQPKNARSNWRDMIEVKA